MSKEYKDEVMAYTYTGIFIFVSTSGLTGLLWALNRTWSGGMDFILCAASIVTFCWMVATVRDFDRRLTHIRRTANRANQSDEQPVLYLISDTTNRSSDGKDQPIISHTK